MLSMVSSSLSIYFPKLITYLGYYDGATELYEFGWADAFHLCRFYKGEGLLQAVSHILTHI